MPTVFCSPFVCIVYIKIKMENEIGGNNYESSTCSE